MYNTQLGYTIKRAYQIATKRSAEALLPLGLSVPQYTVLTILVHSPELSGAALAREAFVSAQAMHELVNGLIKKGLLERKAMENNKKSYTMHLTPTGHRVLQQADAAMAALDRNYAKTVGTVGYEQASSGLAAFNALIH